ncbi:MAG: 6-phosphofructokinase [Planctomycetota bacterium]|jgi:6-phosphofructokinase 1
MADAPKANAVVAQSGGPTGVINASLVGVVEEAAKHAEIQTLYGAVHAVAGMVKDDFIDMGALSADTLELVAGSPSSAIGTSRDKPDAEYCAKILEIFKKRNIRYFFYIGGNDSANTAHILNTMADEIDFDIRAFHIPKTVDNDLLVTDHCPGFGTAALFEACALMGDDLDNRALPGVKIDVIMGRHAGFLTAATALGRQREDDGPHLLYFPERPVSMEKFIADVDGVMSKLGRCVVTVSEGMCDVDGVTWAKKLAETAETDAHGNIQLSGTGALADFLSAQVKEKLKVKRVRADTFGYLQRSFAGLQSKVDADEARRCGREAVKLAMTQDNGSVAMKRLGNGADYAVELFRTELSNVAEHTKSMPDEFINEEGNGITDAFVEYAMPLVGALPKTEYLGGRPRV